MCTKWVEVICEQPLEKSYQIKKSDRIEKFGQLKLHRNENLVELKSVIKSKNPKIWLNWQIWSNKKNLVETKIWWNRNIWLHPKFGRIENLIVVNLIESNWKIRYGIPKLVGLKKWSNTKSDKIEKSDRIKISNRSEKLSQNKKSDGIEKKLLH